MGPTTDDERRGRAELLAAADPERLLRVADRCLAHAPTPELLIEPQVGTVVLTVREPVEDSRFQLGDVLVSRAHLLHRGVEGWAMRLGADPVAAVAAAVCDAEHEAGGPASGLVDELCRTTDDELRRQRADEWAALSPTIVRFEEMA
jgi:alpha-D-ribose 1-methylphosphonate 5-triphosphate synthase subunit PhnG